MKMLFPSIMILGMLLFSCNRTITDITLDDLSDRDEFTGGLVIDCEQYGGKKVERILLNGMEHESGCTLDLSESGFFRIEIFTDRSENSPPEIIRIVILDPERGEAEWGLKKWIPAAISVELVNDQEKTLVYPSKVPGGVNVPLVVIAGREFNASLVNLKAKVGTNGFYIKRGIGSTQILQEELSGAVLTIDHRNFIIDIESFDTTPLILEGTLSNDTNIPTGSFVHIGEDLHIPSNLILTIHGGTFITIDPAVNIYNEGSILMTGSREAPITVTCSEPGAFWDGIIGVTSGNSIEASHTLFCQSGYHTGGVYDYGHAHRQALFYCENGALSFDHCYMTDHAGQVFYPVSASLVMKNSLVQRAITGGQINQSQLTIDNSVFTDFPEDRYHYQDEDNDCLYLMGSDATISNSLFMYARDDGLDSGGSGGGEITVKNTRFEAIFHEGAALSSGGTVSKIHLFSECTFTNCGQGLELGYSSPFHQVTVDSCYFHKNGIGIRYGDNYNSQHDGHISVSNSVSIQNFEQDIWNMVRDTWSADTFNIEFENVRVSSAIPMYPQLKIYE